MRGKNKKVFRKKPCQQLKATCCAVKTCICKMAEAAEKKYTGLNYRYMKDDPATWVEYIMEEMILFKGCGLKWNTKGLLGTTCARLEQKKWVCDVRYPYS